MALRVHIVCQNPTDDRIIPRMARVLRERLGWTLGAAPSKCDVLYLSAYFEAQRLKPWPDVPVAAYFTHREEIPPGNDKARVFERVGSQVQLRIVTCKLYGDQLSIHGPTAQVAAPLERDHFTLEKRPKHKRPVIGFSGYTYRNHRKGEDLAEGLTRSEIAMRVEWRASGRGWPVTTHRFRWAEMPAFYQGLDVLVCPSRVEGIPMPPLEALACGVRIVIPRGVGLLDELPEIRGIYRFDRGDLPSLLEALERAAFPGEPVDREELRAVTEPYSIEAWCEDHERAFEEAFGSGPDAGIEDERWNVEMFERLNVEPAGDGKTLALSGAAEAATTNMDVDSRFRGNDGGRQDVDSSLLPASAGMTGNDGEVEMAKLKDHGTGSTRGVFCVAFGDPARTCALRMMESAKKHMPEIPIALCSDRKIGPEDMLIIEPDSDVGGRRAKLKAYELAPAEWQSVLYLDADTEVVAPVYQFFEWVEDGWELVICTDVDQTLHRLERRVEGNEMTAIETLTGSLHIAQLNGGVWAFRRCPAVADFFARWRAEYEKFLQRDQGALIRALYAAPLKVWLLGLEWNTFVPHCRDVTTAGIRHYPGRARRWKKMIRGRLDGPVAWAAVKKFEGVQ